MGFMDKVKSQASALAEKAQEGAKAGQEKLSQMQSKKQSDALLLEFGGIVYLERSGRPESGGEARVEELIVQLRAHEAQYGPVSVTSAVPQPGATGSYVPGGGSSPAEDAGASSVPPPPMSVPGAGSAMPSPSVGGIPTSSPGGGIPTSSPGGGIPTSSGIPTASPGGGIPTASDDEPAAE